MAGTLLRLRRRFDVKLIIAENFFRQIMATPSGQVDHTQRYLVEGVISDAWQAYCDFSREICFASAMGSTTKNSVALASTINPVSWERASYLSLAGAKGQPLKAVALNAEKWKEPTFGDSDKIGNIIAALNPGNTTALKQGLLSGSTGPKHCQIVRNACAHKNDQTLKTVTDLASQYIAHPITWPSEAATWRDPTTHDYAFALWIEHMRSNADAAIA